MAKLAPSTNVGGSASSLIKTASSLTAQIQAYEDSQRAYEYQNSAYTDDAFNSYKEYLTGRISTLSTSGTISNAQKALTLTKTLDSATKSNISASITRENIQIMAGNASLTDKYNLIASQFGRAMANGDLTLAQSLESQAYSVSQSIQYQAQQAASARATLSTARASTEGETVSNLSDALKSFTGLAKNASEKVLNSTLKQYVQDNKATFQALGVNIATDQPNYWDVVNGIAGAIYNHKVLQAQAEAPVNPLVARTYAIEAQNYLSGATKFSTLGGSLTMQELQQAMVDPAMFAFDNTSGSYKRTNVTGYQYLNENGQQTLAPTYGGMIGQAADKVYFLTPNQTTAMTKLGLNFSENKNQTTGNGALVQASANTPDWLKKILGTNGAANFYTDGQGNLVFKAASEDGKGDSTGNAFYTLTTDASGLHGLFEHTLDGKISLAGGDYGFNAGAAQLLINQSQQIQQNISMQQQLQQAELKLAPSTPLPNISIAPPPQSQNISVPKISSPAITPPTVNPQKPTVNPQQPAGGNLQGAGINLQGGGGGIRLY